jgi:hypothetical protein
MLTLLRAGLALFYLALFWASWSNRHKKGRR